MAPIIDLMIFMVVYRQSKIESHSRKNKRFSIHAPAILSFRRLSSEHHFTVMVLLFHRNVILRSATFPPQEDYN